MNDEQWNTFAMLLDKGFKWREPFGEAQEFTYRTLLDGYDPEQVAAALRALVARGQVFGPTPGEIVALIRADPGKPTFDETLVLIGRALRAYNEPLTGEFTTEGQMIRAREQRVLDRAQGLHPLAASFITRRGVARLQEDIAGLDGEYGSVRRRDLMAAWEEHCEACEGRDIAALTAPRGEHGLARLDPLAALGLGRRRELATANMEDEQ